MFPWKRCEMSGVVQVLATAEANKGMIRVDPLQKLHTLSNVAELLAAGVRGIPRTLRDGSLQTEANAICQVTTLVQDLISCL